MAIKDLPDYTQQVIIRYEGGFIGLEELAVRLGSVVPWDAKGNVVLMEDFSTELTEWTDQSSGDDFAATRSSRHKASGSWSVKLYCPSGGGSYADIQRLLHFPGVGKYALFTLLGWDNTAGQLEAYIALYSGSNQYQAQVLYDVQNETLEVLTSGDTLQSIATGLSLSQSSVVWYPLLLTFDLENEVYDKLYFAGTEYDISSVAIYKTTSSSDPITQIDFAAHPYNSTEYSAYVDCAILTKNVP